MILCMGKTALLALLLMTFTVQAAPVCQDLFKGPPTKTNPAKTSKVGIKDYSFNREAFNDLSDLIGPELTPDLYKALKAISVVRFIDSQTNKLLKKDLDFINIWLKKPKTYIDGFFTEPKSKQKFVETLNQYQVKLQEKKYNQESIALLRIYLEAQRSYEVNGIEAVRKQYQITLPESIALLEYSLSGYKTINSMQRKNSSDAAHVNYLIQLIDNVINKLPDYKGQVVRGLNLRPEVAAGLIKGGIYTAPNYMSTSKTTPFPNDYRMVIQTKSGKDISGLVAIKSENEVLIRKGTQFRIDDIFTNSFATFIYMTEL